MFTISKGITPISMQHRSNLDLLPESIGPKEKRPHEGGGEQPLKQRKISFTEQFYQEQLKLLNLIKLTETYEDAVQRYLELLKTFYKNFIKLEEDRDFIFVPGLFIQNQENGPFELYQVALTEMQPAVRVAVAKSRENLTDKISVLTSSDEEKAVAQTYAEIEPVIKEKASSAYRIGVDYYVVYQEETYELKVETLRPQISIRPEPPLSDHEANKKAIQTLCESLEATENQKNIEDTVNTIGQSLAEIYGTLERDLAISFRGFLFSFDKESDEPLITRRKFIVIQPDRSMALVTLRKRSVVNWDNMQLMVDQATEIIPIGTSNELIDILNNLLNETSRENRFKYVRVHFRAWDVDGQICFCSSGWRILRPEDIYTETPTPDFTPLEQFADEKTRGTVGQPEPRRYFVSRFVEILASLPVPVTVTVARVRGTEVTKQSFRAQQRSSVDNTPLFLRVEEGIVDRAVVIDAVADAMAAEDVFDPDDHDGIEITIRGERSNEISVKIDQLLPELSEEEEDVDYEDKVENSRRRREKAVEKFRAQLPEDPSDAEAIQQVRERDLDDADDNLSSPVFLDSRENSELGFPGDVTNIDTRSALAADYQRMVFLKLCILASNIKTLSVVGKIPLQKFMDYLLYYDNIPVNERREVVLRVSWNPNGKQTVAIGADSPEENLLYDSYNGTGALPMPEAFLSTLTARVAAEVNSKAVMTIHLFHRDPVTGKELSQSRSIPLDIMRFSESVQIGFPSEVGLLRIGNYFPVQTSDPDTQFLSDEYPVFTQADLVNRDGWFMYNGYAFKTLRQVHAMAKFMEFPDIMQLVLESYISGPSEKTALDRAVVQGEIECIRRGRDISKFRAVPSLALQVFLEAARVRLFFDGALLKKIRDFFATNPEATPQLRQPRRVVNGYNAEINAPVLSIDEILTGATSTAIRDAMWNLQKEFAAWVLDETDIDPVWMTRVSPSPLLLEVQTEAYFEPGKYANEAAAEIWADVESWSQILVLAIPRNQPNQKIAVFASLPAPYSPGELLEWPGDAWNDENRPEYFFLGEDAQIVDLFSGGLNSFTMQRNLRAGRQNAPGTFGGFSSGNALFPTQKAVIGETTGSGVPDTVIEIRFKVREGGDSTVFVSDVFNLVDLLNGTARSDEIQFLDITEVNPAARTLPPGASVVEFSSVNPNSPIQKLVAIVSTSQQTGHVTLSNFFLLPKRTAQVPVVLPSGSEDLILAKARVVAERTGEDVETVLEKMRNGEVLHEISFEEIGPGQESATPSPTRRSTLMPTTPTMPNFPDVTRRNLEEISGDVSRFVSALDSGDHDELLSATEGMSSHSQSRQASQASALEELSQEAEEILLDPTQNPYVTTQAPKTKKFYNVVNDLTVAKQRNLGAGVDTEFVSLYSVASEYLEQISIYEGNRDQSIVQDLDEDQRAEVESAYERTVEDLMTIQRELESALLAGAEKDKVEAFREKLVREGAQESKPVSAEELRKATIKEFAKKKTAFVDPVSMFDFAWPFREEPITAEGEEEDVDILDTELVPALKNPQLRKLIEAMRILRPELFEDVPGEQESEEAEVSRVPLMATFVVDGVVFTCVWEYIVYQTHKAVAKSIRDREAASEPTGAVLDRITQTIAELETAPGQSAAKSPYRLWDNVFEILGELTKINKAAKTPENEKRLSRTLLDNYSMFLREKFVEWAFVGLRAQLGQNPELYFISGAFIDKQLQREPIINLTIDPLVQVPPCVASHLKKMKTLSRLYTVKPPAWLPPSLGDTPETAPKITVTRLVVNRGAVSAETQKNIRSRYALVRARMGAAEFGFAPPEELAEDFYYARASSVVRYLESAEMGVGMLPVEILAIDLLTIEKMPEPKKKPKKKQGSEEEPEAEGEEPEGEENEPEEESEGDGMFIAAMLTVHIANIEPTEIDAGENKPPIETYIAQKSNSIITVAFGPSATVEDARMLIELVESNLILLPVKLRDKNASTEIEAAVLLYNSTPIPDLLYEGLYDDWAVSVVSPDKDERFVAQNSRVDQARVHYSVRCKAAEPVARVMRDFWLSFEEWGTNHFRSLGTYRLLRELPLPYVQQPGQSGLLLATDAVPTGITCLRVALVVDGGADRSRQLYSTDWHPVVIAVDGRVSFLPVNSREMVALSMKAAQTMLEAGEGAEMQEQIILEPEDLLECVHAETLVLDWGIDGKMFSPRTIMLPVPERNNVDFMDGGFTALELMDRRVEGKSTFWDGEQPRPDSVRRAEDILLNPKTLPVLFNPEDKMCSLSGQRTGYENQQLRFVVHSAKFLRDRARNTTYIGEERTVFFSKALPRIFFEESARYPNITSLIRRQRVDALEKGYVSAKKDAFLDMPPMYSPAESKFSILRRHLVGTVLNESDGFYGLEVEFNNNLYNDGVDKNRITFGAFHVLTKKTAETNAELLRRALIEPVLQGPEPVPVPVAPKNPKQVETRNDGVLPIGTAFDAMDAMSGVVVQIGFSAEQKLAVKLALNKCTAAKNAVMQVQNLDFSRERGVLDVVFFLPGTLEPPFFETDAGLRLKPASLKSFVVQFTVPGVAYLFKDFQARTGKGKFSRSFVIKSLYDPMHQAPNGPFGISLRIGTEKDGVWALSSFDSSVNIEKPVDVERPAKLLPKIFSIVAEEPNETSLKETTLFSALNYIKKELAAAKKVDKAEKARKKAAETQTVPSPEVVVTQTLSYPPYGPDDEEVVVVGGSAAQKLATPKITPPPSPKMDVDAISWNGAGEQNLTVTLNMDTGYLTLNLLGVGEKIFKKNPAALRFHPSGVKDAASLTVARSNLVRLESLANKKSVPWIEKFTVTSKGVEFKFLRISFEVGDNRVSCIMPFIYENLEEESD